MRTLHMHWIRFKSQGSHVCFYSKICLIDACLIHSSICFFMNKAVKNAWRTLLFHVFSQSWTMQSRQDVYTFAKHLAWSSICSYIYMYRNITRTYKSSDSRSRAPINTCTQTLAGLVFSNEIFIAVSLEGIMQSGQHRCHTHGHTNQYCLNSP